MAPKDDPQPANTPTESTTPPSPPPTPADRTVNDFKNEAELARALLQAVSLEGEENADWTLRGYDLKTTISNPNNTEDEVQRLMTLKSYDILDSESEVEFDEITSEAKKFFQCPIAVISLVDVGRQWFKSIQGLDAKQTPRCLAFCAHVVKRKQEHGVMVVKDATQDPRFASNPLVTGGPQIRFYAGAPLISPEGDRLGSFCVIDMKPHPEGLSDSEQERLQCFAQEAVLHMITRL
jgi:GAF domain-containing protein